MMDAIRTSAGERLLVKDIELEVVRQGTGRPVLLLHGMQHVDLRARFLDLLSRQAEIIAPSHPGFGRSARPADFDSVYDLVHLYLDVLDALPYERVTLVGLSFGGWLAAEIAVKCCHRIDRLVLVDAFGIKLSDRETPDILNVFNTSPQEVQRQSWHDPEKWVPNFNAMSDDELVVRAQNWDALCLYGWHPYMYNPQLKRWLRRITRPTLVLWGASDGIVKPSYGRAYSELIPGSRFELISEAGSANAEKPVAPAILNVGGLTSINAEQAMARGILFAGSPDTVYQQIMDFYARVGGFGHLVMIGRSGFMTHAEAEKGIKLFAKEVLPRLKEVAPISAG